MSWFSLNLDIRNLIRDELVTSEDYATLASLRMTSHEEDQEQVHYFQWLPCTSHCSWTVDDISGEFILKRPRGNFCNISRKFGYTLLRDWATKDAGYTEVEPTHPLIRKETNRVWVEDFWDDGWVS
jgi:hypothetical protein